MKRQTLALFIGVITVVAGVAFAKLARTHTSEATRPAATTPETRRDWQAGRYRLSGPYTHQNLTIFLAHGPESSAGRTFLTLEEAMGRKLVVVHETQEVNELSIENVSRTEEVFVQAGDIVKGGQQDRVLAVDLIVPARSGRVPVDAFCVEQGRWSARGAEPAAAFSMSGEMAATKELKMAAKSARSQQQVWGEVARAQEKLSMSTNANVRAKESASSLQLSLENEKVREGTDAYMKALSTITESQPDVIGYVMAVNGRASGADIYASSALFRKLWPRLLKAAAVEAVAELAVSEGSAATSIDSIREFLLDAESGRQSEREVTKRTTMLKREGERAVFFETRDMARGGAWVHRSYLAE
jgi:hypothetical protein